MVMVLLKVVHLEAQSLIIMVILSEIFLVVPLLYKYKRSDLYDEFSRSWDLAGSPNNGKLKPWLDPTNSGVTFVDGLYCGVSSTASFNVTKLIFVAQDLIQLLSTIPALETLLIWQFTGGSPSVHQELVHTM